MRGLYVSFLIFAQVIQTNAKGRITFNKRIINGVCPHDIGLGVCFFNRGYVCKDDYDCPIGSKCCQTTCGRNLCKTVKPLDDTTVRPIQCWLQKAEGHCDRRRLRYYYNAAEGKCKKFIYQGCSGNNNRFTTKQECQKTCRVGVKKSTPRKSRIKPTPSKNRKNKTIAPKRKTGILKRKKATPKQKTTAKKRKISSVSSWKPSNRITLKRKSSSSSNRVTVRRKSSKRKTVTPKRSSTSRRKDRKLIRPNKKTPKSASKRIRVHRRPFVCDLRHDGNRCSNVTLSYYYDKQTKKCHRFYYTGCLSPASIIRSRAGCYMICM